MNISRKARWRKSFLINIAMIITAAAAVGAATHPLIGAIVAFFMTVLSEDACKERDQDKTVAVRISCAAIGIPALVVAIINATL